MKLVCGLGVYRKGKHLAKQDGHQTTVYHCWKSMIGRCISGGQTQTKQPSYIGCSVHPDFIHFQDFAEWCQHQIGFGLPDYQLDKDILVPGNKVYGPNTCCFVPAPLNSLLIQDRCNKGLYPTGVSWHKASSKFIAQIRLNGLVNYLGLYDSVDDASVSYRSVKLVEIHRQAEFYKESIDIRVYNALINYKF